MTVVIAFPNASSDRELATKSICGIPLFVRVVAGAAKAGADEFVFFETSHGHSPEMRRVLAHPLISRCRFKVLPVEVFDPDDVHYWVNSREALPPVFVWIPWNLLVSKAALKKLITERQGTIAPRSFSAGATFWQQAVVLRRDDVLNAPVSKQPPVGANVAADEGPFLVTSSAEISAVERQLIRNSGKETDGLYSRMNRRMCRQPLKFLCRTPVTPNAITALGLLLSALSGYFFAQGHWSAGVLGALAYFACVLCDEMDGMLARLKFSDSAFGCWLETVADYASYMFLFTGLTAGLYRQSGVLWLWSGVLMIGGSILLMLVLSYQRKMITDPDKPHEFRKQLQHTLERDSSNPISRLGRNLEFMIRKPAYCYWVLIFCTLGLTKLFVALTAFGVNVAWMMALSYTRLFRPIRLERTALGGKQP